MSTSRRRLHVPISFFTACCWSTSSDALASLKFEPLAHVRLRQSSSLGDFVRRRKPLTQPAVGNHSEPPRPYPLQLFGSCGQGRSRMMDWSAIYPAVSHEMPDGATTITAAEVSDLMRSLPECCMNLRVSSAQLVRKHIVWTMAISIPVVMFVLCLRLRQCGDNFQLTRSLLDTSLAYDWAACLPREWRLVWQVRHKPAIIITFLISRCEPPLLRMSHAERLTAPGPRTDT